jgi:hypothetical protein
LPTIWTPALADQFAAKAQVAQMLETFCGTLNGTLPA